ncbi:protein GIGAS CELL1 [Hordeum vulgare]|nr:protein GIGAS CELL1 [Hordeum vulgare]
MRRYSCGQAALLLGASVGSRGRRSKAWRSSGTQRLAGAWSGKWRRGARGLEARSSGDLRIGVQDSERKESEILSKKSWRIDDFLMGPLREVLIVEAFLQECTRNLPQETLEERRVKMAEVRIASRTAAADRSGGGGGFFVRRVVSPGAVVDKGAVKPLARLVPSLSSNKENVPPAWAAWTAPKRRSFLPEWYPRTPLRDITSIIKAVERKSRLQDAAARHQLQWDDEEDSSEPDDEEYSSEPENPAQTDEGIHRSTAPTNETLCVGSAQVVETTAASATCLGEGKCATVVKASDDCSLQSPSRPSGEDDVEKQLANSIHEIEKMVSRNLKRTDPKATRTSKTPAVQRRTLMSMR